MKLNIDIADHGPLEWQPLWDLCAMSWNARSAVWHETTQDIFDHMLGAVPPEAMIGDGFACGEPVRHNANGQPVFNCFIFRGGRYFTRQMSLSAFKAFYDPPITNQVIDAS